MSARRHPLLRLLAYIARRPGLVGLSLLTMIAGAGVDLLLPEIVKRAVDGPITGGDGGFASLPAGPEGLRWYALAATVVLLFAAALRAARTIVSVMAGRLIGMSLRLEVFRQIQAQGMRFFDRTPVGVLTTRVTGDVEAVEEFFSSGVAAVFHDILKLVLILLVLFAVHAQLALCVVAVLPLLALAGVVFARRSRRDFTRVRSEVAASNGYTTEAIAGLSVTRLFQRESRAIERYSGHAEALCDAHVATVRNFALFFPSVQVLSALTLALVVHFGADGIGAGTFTYGEFFQFYLLINLFFEPIRTLAENLNMMLQAMVSGERLFGVLDTAPEIVDGPDARGADRLRGAVRFDEVHFGYRADEPVLRGVSFDVPAGSTLAIVGPTGAGKSSILNLISRFYDVQQGAVTVDGVDVRDYARRALRARIAIVLQDVFLFRGSVLDNVRLFDESITREKVTAALHTVHADDLLARVAGGLDAPIEERGANLSTGERQLLAFARALVHDPAILVLDEATSSVDTATERRVQEGLDALRRDRTTIIVAHRLSTIRSADQILVMQRGRIAEQGTHAELLALGGLYRRLYDESDALRFQG
ncbi:MAG: ABC transporter ATP-binding protein [Planctomycetota bacterium]|nr:ABC transporter ATP-binding protein [Planctomycetota bacterium]